MAAVSEYVHLSGLAAGETRNAVLHALAAISKVHGLGEMLVSRVIEKRASRKNHGGYDPVTHEISVSRGAPSKELTAVEEIGHKIHDEAFGFASGAGDTPLDKAIKPWAAAAARTRTVKDLSKAVRESKNPAVKAHLAYLARPEEQFARDYSQYIALKSGSATLLAQIQKEQADIMQFGHLAYRPDEEVQAVSAAFDKIFALKGWI
jgi:hypothetical protein